MLTGGNGFLEAMEDNHLEGIDLCFMIQCWLVAMAIHIRKPYGGQPSRRHRFIRYRTRYSLYRKESRKISANHAALLRLEFCSINRSLSEHKNQFSTFFSSLFCLLLHIRFSMNSIQNVQYNNGCWIFEVAINWFIIYEFLFSTFSKRKKKMAKKERMKKKKMVFVWVWMAKQNCQSVSGAVVVHVFSLIGQKGLGCSCPHNENDEWEKTDGPAPCIHTTVFLACHCWCDLGCATENRCRWWWSTHCVTWKMIVHQIHAYFKIYTLSMLSWRLSTLDGWCFTPKTS